VFEDTTVQRDCAVSALSRAASPDLQILADDYDRLRRAILQSELTEVDGPAAQWTNLRGQWDDLYALVRLTCSIKSASMAMHKLKLRMLKDLFDPGADDICHELIGSLGRDVLVGPEG
jgi:hypothetical protein